MVVSPVGMALALLVTALALGLVASIAIGLNLGAAADVKKIAVVNGFFISLFLISASLFHRAARGGTSAAPDPSA